MGLVMIGGVLILGLLLASVFAALQGSTEFQSDILPSIEI